MVGVLKAGVVLRRRVCSLSAEGTEGILTETTEVPGSESPAPLR